MAWCRDWHGRGAFYRKSSYNDRKIRPARSFNENIFFPNTPDGDNFGHGSHVAGNIAVINLRSTVRSSQTGIAQNLFAETSDNAASKVELATDPLRTIDHRRAARAGPRTGLTIMGHKP